jgi:hypothetical protein
VKIDDLKKAKDRRPFEPFLIRLTDGREVEVRHPDAVAWGSEGSRTVTYVTPDDQWWMIDIGLVTALRLAPAQPKGDSNGA